MTSKKDDIKFALDFPQGHILFMSGGGAYFHPHKGADAFMVWGERKELFGKNAITVSKDRDTGAGGYSVVYEFAENGALSDARLVNGTQTLRGALADSKTLQGLNDALAQGEITLYNRRDTEPASVFNAARFPDGRLLIQLANKNELYLGKPGSYEKLDATLQVQGGCSMYYKTAKGDSIALPYGMGGPGYDDIPKFNEEELTYVNVRPGQPPDKFGLDLSSGIRHLDPFSPEVAAPRPVSTPKPAPKAPGL